MARQCTKDVKNRGNELKDLLEIKDLACFWSEKRTQNELILNAKMRELNRKSGFWVALFTRAG